MKDKDDLKDKAIEYGIDIAKSLVLALISSKFGKKNKVDTSITVKDINQTKKEKKKKKFSVVKTLALGYLFKEIVYDRLKAKLNHKPDTKDYSWLLDYPAGKENIDMQSMINEIKPDDKIIDLGCGLGYFGISCAKKADKGKSYLLDQDMNILTKAQKNAQEQGVDNIEIHRAYIEKLPFDDYFFDKAYLNISIGQLPDKVKALTEIRRILKEKGKLYITEIMNDDYYCLSSNIINIATSSGLKVVSEKGNFLGYTLVFEK